MNVFVTGHRGYIGSHLVAVLKEAGHCVTGCDLHLYDACAFLPSVAADRSLQKDIRTLTTADLRGYDCVMHLAALSNDPMGEMDERFTLSINSLGSLHLARLAKEAGVPLFLFASSCSIYGKQGDETLDENSPLAPQSAYARSKIEAEQAIGALADASFSPAFLRNATAYGLSPMLRLDLVANDLLASAFTRNEIRLMSDGTAWRPLIHAKDIARAFLAFMEAPRSLIRNQAVNIGANEENYQVRSVAKAVFCLLPESKIVFTGEIGADPRNYRVNFDKLARLLPRFRLSYTLQSGLAELLEAFRTRPLLRSECEEKTFIRLTALKSQLRLIKNQERDDDKTMSIL